MVQFVNNGPDIPDELLQAHEEGRVIFFCGAGISYPAGLPGFKDLVDKIYEISLAKRTPTEQEAFDKGQFDTTPLSRPRKKVIFCCDRHCPLMARKASGCWTGAAPCLPKQACTCCPRTGTRASA